MRWAPDRPGLVVHACVCPPPGRGALACVEIRDGRVAGVETPRGRIVVLTPSERAARFAGIEVWALARKPYIAGLQVTTGDLAQAAGCLSAAGIAHAADGESLRIAPAEAFGAALEFVQG